MTIRICEACGSFIYRPASWQILCDLCARVLDAQVELLLELEHLEDTDDDFDL
jgi:hypothetical protein